ncbi:MAG: hypothetical protein P8J86_09090 [Phycisphaerales bacterium]|nr:hypothetical protein [Phycisphaerales bacterium]
MSEQTRGSWSGYQWIMVVLVACLVVLQIIFVVRISQGVSALEDVGKTAKHQMKNVGTAAIGATDIAGALLNPDGKKKDKKK